MSLITENIHIAILGPVSAGKSTLFNALCSNTCSDMKRRKTTMLPQIYEITTEKGKIDSIDYIYNKNKESNEKVLQLRENGQFNVQRDFVELIHKISPISEFITLPDKKATYSILDMPGLNCGGDTIYFDYIRNKSKDIDIYLLVFDINSGLNTTDEINIIQLVVQEIKKNSNGYIHFLINKCDEISFDSNNKVNLGDEELDELYERCVSAINKQCADIIDRISFGPICSSKLYVYRGVKNDIVNIDENHLDNIIKEECGKTELKKLTDTKMKRKFISGLLQQREDMYKGWMDETGYNYFMTNISSNISKNYKDIVYYHINKEIEKVAQEQCTSIDAIIEKITRINARIDNVKKVTKNKLVPAYVMKNLDIINQKLDKYIISGVDSYSGSNLDIVNSFISKIVNYFTVLTNIYSSNPLQESKQALENKRNKLLENSLIEKFTFEVFEELYNKNLITEDIIKKSCVNSFKINIDMFNSIIKEMSKIKNVPDKLINTVILEYIIYIKTLKFDFGIFQTSLKTILDFKSKEVQLISNIIKIYFNNNMDFIVVNYWNNLNYSTINLSSTETKYIYLNLSHQNNKNYLSVNTSTNSFDKLENYSISDFKQDFVKLDTVFEMIKSKFDTEFELPTSKITMTRGNKNYTQDLDESLDELLGDFSSSEMKKNLSVVKNDSSDLEEYYDSDDSREIYKKATKNSSKRAKNIYKKGAN